MIRTSLRSAASALPLAALLAHAAPAQQIVTRANLDSAGNQTADGESTQPALSGDGRFVAFISDSDTLVSGVSGTHAFVHDAFSGTTEVADVDSNGVLANDDAEDVAISRDGRFVAFSTYAGNLVPNDTNTWRDVFVHDRATGLTERVSVDSSGTIQGDNDSWGPSISADGRFVSFLSRARTLVPGITNYIAQVYVHDRSTGATEIESVDGSGNAGDMDSDNCAISGDGGFVAFMTEADNLAPGDSNGWWDALVRDRATGTITIATLDSNGVQRSCLAYSPVAVSDGATCVAFESYDQCDVNLHTSALAVFVRDRVNGTTTCASVATSGAVADGDCDMPVLSADGRFCGFSSGATNLASDPKVRGCNVYLRDRTLGVTLWCSANPSGKSGNGDSGDPDNGNPIAVSADGSCASYTSSSSDLVAGDTNGQDDLFTWGPALDLSIDPLAAHDGDVMTFAAWSGMPGALVMLVAVNIDGIPNFIPVVMAAFDASGRFSLSGIVPFGLSGHQITFDCFGLLPDGKSGASPRRQVIFN